MNHIKSANPINKMIDSIFNSSISDIIGTEFTNNQPSVNIVENDSDFEIELAVPGFTKEGFSIEVLKDQLSVSTKTTEPDKATIDSYTRREYDYSSFKRSFHLPENIDRESITANYADGILKIGIGKKEASTESSRSIDIS